MNTIKQFLLKTPILGGFLLSIYKKKKTYEFDSPSVWIDTLLLKKEISIIQIGSNDGIHGDPINSLIKQNTNWQALFVEPIPYLFNRLKQNYGQDSRFNFENAAINDGSKQSFYSVKESAKNHIPNLPKWYDQLGSFNRENIVKHLNGVLEPFIEETILTGLTLEMLFQKYNIKQFNLLHIDTEGYDWKILSQLNLKLYCPEIILYEHVHLSAKEKEESINHLKEKYNMFELGGDIICIMRKLMKNTVPQLKGKKLV